MKSILENEYNPSMGVLIDVRSEKSYQKKHNPYSVNIHYDSLLLNYKTLLNKNEKYFLICDTGKRSKQATRILTFYGYDATYVINS